MAESATIHVIAPTGSNIIFSKNGIIINGLYSSEGFVDQLDTTLTHYYYNIQSQSFGEWVITSSRNTNENTSKTIIISENKQYDISINYNLYLFKRADQCSNITGGWAASALAPDNTTYSAQNPTVVYETERVHVYSTTTKRYGAFLTKNKIDVTNYSLATIRAKRPTETAHGWVVFCLNAYNSGKSHNPIISTNVTTGNNFVERTLNISNISGSYYIGIQAQGNELTSGYLYRCYIYDVFLTP